MGFWGGIAGAFKGLGKLIMKGLRAAHEAGLTDEVVDLALKWVKVAAGKEIDNAAKREFVVAILKARGLSESVARLAVELAVRLLKAELKKLPGEEA